MFSGHYRKVKAIFGLTDIVLVAVAFVAAYETRQRLPFERHFELDFPVAPVLLLVSAMCWVAIGYWLDVYDRLDSAHPRVILRDTFRQCALGAICVVVAEYMLRLDLSRFFVSLFAVYSWMLLCLFRMNAGHVVGIIRREFGSS